MLRAPGAFVHWDIHGEPRSLTTHVEENNTEVPGSAHRVSHWTTCDDALILGPSIPSETLWFNHPTEKHGVGGGGQLLMLEKLECKEPITSSSIFTVSSKGPTTSSSAFIVNRKGPTTSSLTSIVNSTDNTCSGFPSLVRLMQKPLGGLCELPRDLSFVRICTPIHAPAPSGFQWELDTTDCLPSTKAVPILDRTTIRLEPPNPRAHSQLSLSPSQPTSNQSEHHMSHLQNHTLNLTASPHPLLPGLRCQ